MKYQSHFQWGCRLTYQERIRVIHRLAIVYFNSPSSIQLVPA